VGVLTTMGAEALLTLAKPWPVAILVDNVLGGHPLAGWQHAIFGRLSRASVLDWAVAATVVIFVADWAVTMLGNYVRIGYGQRLVYDLAGRLFDHLQRLSMRLHARRGVGDAVRRVTADSTCASTIVVDGLLPVVQASVTLALMTAVMVRLDAPLAAIALAVIPFLVWSLHRYAAPMTERGYQLEEAESALYDHVERHVSAVQVVQAFNGEEEAEQAMRAAADTVLGAAVRLIDPQLRFKILTGLVMALGAAAVFWVGAQQAMSGQLGAGTIIVFVSYLYSLYQPLESIMYTSSTVQSAAGSARRVLEVLGTDPEVADERGAPPLPPVHGDIGFEEVSFAYEPGRLVLQGVNLRVGAGQTVALVGATGAGKSTLAGLVPRFYDPTSGRVLIDGHDVRHVQLASVRRQVSVVLQDSLLFPISVADNIAYGRPGATRAEIEAAGRAANVDELVTRLSDGYDTVVGERGTTLSGGERQRVAIARALIKDAPILILDEPTSALDAATEHLVFEALERLMAGRTTLVIAHRLSTIRRADHIVVVDAGRIVETGTHRELLAAGGRYALLAALDNGTLHAGAQAAGRS
jgi:ATP-binding cassette subfamily B protein/subfamily B ATP-binding cassette protein MsbA